jgi:hypothetical protein
MSKSSSSSSISSSGSSEDNDKIQEAVNLSVEEKVKLYEAIGYTGDEAKSQYPKDVKFSIIKNELLRY